MVSGTDLSSTIKDFLAKLSAFLDGMSTAIPNFGVILTIVLGLLWILVTWQVIKNFDKIKHSVMLVIMTLFEGGRRRSIIGFLAEKKISVDIIYEKGGKRIFLCVAKILRASGDTVTLEVLKDKGLERAPKGIKIWCYYRPIWHFHLRTNNFQSFYLSRSTNKAGKDIVKIKMPLSTGDLSRRRFKRKRIKSQRTIIARVWLRTPENSGGDRFRYSPPAFQVNVDFSVTRRNEERVFDISERGIKLGIAKKRCKEVPHMGDDVLLEIKPFIKDERSFRSYIFAGKVRNKGRSKTGMMTYGLEFTGVGKRVFGKVSDLVWEDIEDSSAVRDFKRAIIQL